MVTVWAVLILSARLVRTGVAGQIGRPVLRLAGGSEARLIAMIMLLVGVLSGFMNDIGVAALMLPVVVDIARRARVEGEGTAGRHGTMAGGQIPLGDRGADQMVGPLKRRALQHLAITPEGAGERLI